MFGTCKYVLPFRLVQFQVELLIPTMKNVFSRLHAFFDLSVLFLDWFWRATYRYRLVNLVKIITAWNFPMNLTRTVVVIHRWIEQNKWNKGVFKDFWSKWEHTANSLLKLRPYWFNRLLLNPMSADIEHEHAGIKLSIQWLTKSYQMSLNRKQISNWLRFVSKDLLALYLPRKCTTPENTTCTLVNTKFQCSLIKCEVNNHWTLNTNLVVRQTGQKWPSKSFPMPTGHDWSHECWREIESVDVWRVNSRIHLCFVYLRQKIVCEIEPPPSSRKIIHLTS